MNKKIALLRGINVGGSKKLPMAELKELCENLGWQNVSSYIQSGNLVFESEIENHQLENTLNDAIRINYGYEVPVIVRSRKEWEDCVSGNPFFNDTSDITRLHCAFLKRKPSPEAIKKLSEQTLQQDRFEIIDRFVYIDCEGKYHQSRLNNNFLEKILEVSATTRNWKTVLKLLELSKPD